MPFGSLASARARPPGSGDDPRDRAVLITQRTKRGRRPATRARRPRRPITCSRSTNTARHHMRLKPAAIKQLHSNSFACDSFDGLRPVNRANKTARCRNLPHQPGLFLIFGILAQRIEGPAIRRGSHLIRVFVTDATACAASLLVCAVFRLQVEEWRTVEAVEATHLQRVVGDADEVNY